MTEGGLVLHWRREVMDEESTSTPSTFQGHTEERWSTAINLKHCQGAAFFLLLLGLAVGGVVLVGGGDSGLLRHLQARLLHLGHCRR
ncbi:hypothetical protein O3P69_016607 [Scylla paramamosain]|uniref:Uncharacterized protein n=1 Tax=Scylla paramamosain TaxID=85552 RepID=A0AAW0SZ92_SCYPA